MGFMFKRSLVMAVQTLKLEFFLATAGRSVYVAISVKHFLNDPPKSAPI